MLIDPTGQALLAAGEHAKAVRHFGALAANNPDDPAPSLGLALALAAAARFGEAEVAITHARSLAPANIDLLAAQANLYEQMGDEAKALQGYLDLLSKDPNHLPAAHNLGSLLYRLGYFAEAAQQHRETLRRHPSSVATWRDLGQALVAGGELEAGIDALARACHLAPNDRDNRFAHGLALLRAERWADGWPLYEARWRPGESPPGQPGIPPWQGESLVGKHLVVFAEQGYGDTLMFSRFLPPLIAEAAQLTLIVPPRLQGLMAANFPGADIAVTPPRSQHDQCTIALGSTPLHLLRRGYRSPQEFPAKLTASSRARQKLEARLGERLSTPATALVWRGNPHNPADRLRSTSLDKLLAYLPPDAGQLISLQIDCDDGECRRMAELGIVDGAQLVDDFDDSAALLGKLSALLSVDTAAVHLAGNLAMPFVLLQRAEREWRWGRDGLGKNWYGSCIKSPIFA